MRKILIIFAKEIKILLIEGSSDTMEYLPIQELANQWNISKRRIQVLCREGRIDGAKMIGNMWVIPKDTRRPEDARCKTPVGSKSNEISAMRRDLKKLLKKLFKTADEKGIADKDKRNSVLSVIAYSLCAAFMNEKKLLTEVYDTIYRDISGKTQKSMISCEMIKIVDSFLEKYMEDSEINNILSWAYQYSNKIIKKNIYHQTQFFTESYMIDYLINHIDNLEYARKIVDPCSGGGNFLVECLECLCKYSKANNIENELITNAKKLYGYDIDQDIARIAIVNIRLRGMAILNRMGSKFTFDIWEKICPQIYISKLYDPVCGSLANDNRIVVDIVTGCETGINDALGHADIVLTNPPFATIKGMIQEEKDFLKEHYPESNCDTCVSFLDAIYGMLKEGGICGIVSQNAWMHLKSFKNIRKKFTSQYTIHNIVNLGSGAFLDLSGEKSNVSLLVVEKGYHSDNIIEVLNLNTLTLKEKIEKTRTGISHIQIAQDLIDGMNGYDLTEKGTLNAIGTGKEYYKDVAVPMQGTSTGNAKELVGFFWEHFGDDDWISVSNGGGYCRWQGLNDSVVKWGKDGEYIKAQKGSALRNVKYFPETQMVFSDTGTAGLNVRVLLQDQIFIASGPGIRIIKGNKYAHLALLNSRLAAYFVRIISPKLTISAGYIGQIPITEKIYSSIVLEKDARLCIELKKKILSTRPNNLEYDASFIDRLCDDLDQAAWTLFNDDITNELLKLETESRIDQYIFKKYGFSEEDQKQLDQCVGTCAYLIDDMKEISLTKLDVYISKRTDASCCLKRTRSSKNSLGSDGIIEFIAKDLGINPESIVRKIQENPYLMQNVLNKYKEMILHNAILYKLGYNTRTGIQATDCPSKDLIDYLYGRFGNSIKYRKWLEESFNSVHNEIFKGVPYLIYENEVIHKYDNRTAE